MGFPFFSFSVIEMNGKGRKSEELKMEVVNRERVVFMWGYLPGALPQRSPLVSPVLVRIPDSIDYSWSDVCGGGCGFAMAISGCFLYLSLSLWLPHLLSLILNFISYKNVLNFR